MVSGLKLLQMTRTSLCNVHCSAPWVPSQRSHVADEAHVRQELRVGLEHLPPPWLPDHLLTPLHHHLDTGSLQLHSIMSVGHHQQGEHVGSVHLAAQHLLALGLELQQAVKVVSALGGNFRT